MNVQTLANAPRQLLCDYVAAICSGDPSVYALLDVERGNAPTDAFISLIEDCSATTRIAIAESWQDVAARIIQELPSTPSRRDSEAIENLLLVAEFLIDCGAADIPRMVEIFELFALAPDVEIADAALRVLSACGSVNAHALMEELKDAADDQARYLAPLLRLRSRLFPLQSLALGARPAALEEAANDPAFVLAVDSTILEMFDQNGPEARDAVVATAQTWPPAARSLLVQILEDRPLSSNPLALEALDLIQGTKRTQIKPWQRYLQKAKERKEVRAIITGFAEVGSPLVSRTPLNVYVNLHHELRADVARSLNLDPKDLKLEYSRPPAMRRLLEPLFQGDELVLDLQWSTEARSRRGQMIRLGEIEALAFVARQKDVTQLKKALRVDTIVPEIAKDLALDDPEEYRRISASLQQIFDLFSSRSNDFKLFVQNDSAIQDKILHMSQDEIEGTAEEERQARSEDMNEMADSLEAIHTLLKDMAITNGTTGVLIEWNPVSPVPEIRQVLSKCRIDSLLHDPLAKERRFVVFPARYTEPLDAGYYYPEGDEEFGTALRNAIFRSYTTYNGDKLEWHPDAIELARQICVRLDPVEQVFAQVDDMGNVVPITQATKLTYRGQT